MSFSLPRVPQSIKIGDDFANSSIGEVILFIFLIIVSYYFFLILIGTAEVKSKLQALPVANVHMVLSSDAKWKIPVDAEIVRLESRVFPLRASRRCIYFMRHGESLWNDVFNKGFHPRFLFKLLKNLIKEINLLPTSDSVYYDSPLSTVGLQQAVDLLKWIQSSKDVNDDAKFLYTGPAVLCTSNLRRATSTTLIALSKRLLRGVSEGNPEKVHVLSSLQEITRNIDGYSLSAPGKVPFPSHLELEDASLDNIMQLYKHKAEILNGSYNSGTKSLLGSNGLKRFSEFARWVFENTTMANATCVIATGHSLWFREFMKTYLPHSSKHTVKTYKLKNCGVVKFELLTTGEGKYYVDESTISVVYGGFEGYLPKLTQN